MNSIPRPALILGVAGTLPFIWAAIAQFSAQLHALGLDLFGPAFALGDLGLHYGRIILAFMSGVLWGFATKDSSRNAPVFYALSVIPALWVFFMTSPALPYALPSLVGGYIGILAIDWLFMLRRLAPFWWLALRLRITAIVVISLMLAYPDTFLDLL